ncbi:hypothetical protein V6259_12690 [Marinomonas sp. TI.3.20]|uniref:hypothetical protein n=1 Tax=Marinomonas sp. TI.3.20 TaxID=3121296 RepID=UPI00311DC764
MPLERIFDERDINELLTQNAGGEHGARNAALILSGVCWGLTPLEQSLVSTESVIAPNGQLYRTWVLPSHESYNGKSRELYTEDHLVPFFQKYIDVRLKKEWGTGGHSHQALLPDKPFLLNDNGERYRINTTAKGHRSAKAMHDQLRKMIKNSGLYDATPASYRASFIKLMYESGAKWTDLKGLTGIKDKRTLEGHVRPHERELESILSKIFSRVKMPRSLE